jgi:hypothetical protein
VLPSELDSLRRLAKTTQKGQRLRKRRKPKSLLHLPNNPAERFLEGALSRSMPRIKRKMKERTLKIFCLSTPRRLASQGLENGLVRLRRSALLLKSQLRMARMLLKSSHSKKKKFSQSVPKSSRRWTRMRRLLLDSLLLNHPSSACPISGAKRRGGEWAVENARLKF